MYNEIILAGFGGQGVLLIGKLLTYAGMKAGLKFHEKWRDADMQAGPLPALFLRHPTSQCADIERLTGQYQLQCGIIQFGIMRQHHNCAQTR